MPMQDGVLINGMRFDWSSVEFSVNGKILTAVGELNYTESLEPAHLRGTKARSLGRSRGEYSAEGSFTIYKELHDELCALLQAQNAGRGYMEGSFTIVVSYTEPLNGSVVVDTLIGCRMTSCEDSHSAGGDVLMVSCDLDILRVKRGGKEAVIEA